jgi:hypothetical protein
LVVKGQPSIADARQHRFEGDAGQLQRAPRYEERAPTQHRISTGGMMKKSG